MDENSFEFVMNIIINLRNLEYCEEIFKNFPEILTVKKNGKYIINRVLNEYINLIINSNNNLLIDYYNQIFNFITKYSYKYIDSEIKEEIITKLKNTKNYINNKNINKQTKNKFNITLNKILCELKGKKFTFNSLEELNLYYNINPNYQEYSLYRDYHDRCDYTNKLVFTIDESSTGLFDDALSFEQNKNGTYTLGIYVADVSSAILPNSSWDKDLRKRCETIYMLDNNIHLFDYTLAHDKFSLVVNRSRKVIAYMYTFSPNMELIDFKIERALINPKKNFNHYEIDDLFYRYTNHFTSNLNNKELLEVLKNLRSFIEQVGFDINQINSYHELKTITRNVYGTNFKNRLLNSDENKDIGSLIVSVLMIFAKNTVALEMNKQNKPFIYVNNSFKMDGNINSILDTYKMNPNNRELIRYIKKITTPSMYGTQNLGHNGLKIDANSEITNPIRKYMSIESSRLIKEFLIDKVVLGTREEENLRQYLDKLCKEQNQIYFNHQEYIKEASKILKKKIDTN